MTETDKPWSERLTALVGSQVERYRREQGLRGEDLAARCTQLGYKLDKHAVSKLETGVRKSVTVAELLVLAAALGVPPLVLLLPLQSAESAEVLAGEDLALDAAAEWLNGSQPIPSVPSTTGETFVLVSRRLGMLPRHWRARREIRAARAALRDLLQQQRLDPSAPISADIEIRQFEVRRAELGLARYRAYMRDAGWRVLPRLDEDLREIDEMPLPAVEEETADA